MASLDVTQEAVEASPVAWAKEFLYGTICPKGIPKAEAPYRPAGVAFVLANLAAFLQTFAMLPILHILLVLLVILPLLTVTLLLAAAA